MMTRAPTTATSKAGRAVPDLVLWGESNRANASPGRGGLHQVEQLVCQRGVGDKAGD